MVQSFLHLGCAGTNPVHGQILKNLKSGWCPPTFSSAGGHSPGLWGLPRHNTALLMMFPLLTQTRECCVHCFGGANEVFAAAVSTAAGRRLPQKPARGAHYNGSSLAPAWICSKKGRILCRKYILSSPL